MKQISLLPLLPPVQTAVLQRSNNGLAAGTRHHVVVNAVCAVGGTKPGIAAQVVGRALDGGCDATGRERSNKLPYGIGGCCSCVTRGCAGVVSSIVSVG